MGNEEEMCRENNFNENTIKNDNFLSDFISKDITGFVKKETNNIDKKILEEIKLLIKELKILSVGYLKEFFKKQHQNFMDLIKGVKNFHLNILVIGKKENIIREVVKNLLNIPQEEIELKKALDIKELSTSKTNVYHAKSCLTKNICFCETVGFENQDIKNLSKAICAHIKLRKIDKNHLLDEIHSIIYCIDEDTEAIGADIIFDIMETFGYQDISIPIILVSNQMYGEKEMNILNNFKNKLGLYEHNLKLYSLSNKDENYPNNLISSMIEIVNKSKIGMYTSFIEEFIKVNKDVFSKSHIEKPFQEAINTLPNEKKNNINNSPYDNMVNLLNDSLHKFFNEDNCIFDDINIAAIKLIVKKISVWEMQKTKVYLENLKVKLTSLSKNGGEKAEIFKGKDINEYINMNKNYIQLKCGSEIFNFFKNRFINDIKDALLKTYEKVFEIMEPYFCSEIHGVLGKEYEKIYIILQELYKNNTKK